MFLILLRPFFIFSLPLSEWRRDKRSLHIIERGCYFSPRRKGRIRPQCTVDGPYHLDKEDIFISPERWSLHKRKILSLPVTHMESVFSLLRGEPFSSFLHGRSCPVSVDEGHTIYWQWRSRSLFQWDERWEKHFVFCIDDGSPHLSIRKALPSSQRDTPSSFKKAVCFLQYDLIDIVYVAADRLQAVIAKHMGEIMGFTNPEQSIWQRLSQMEDSSVLYIYIYHGRLSPREI